MNLLRKIFIRTALVVVILLALEGLALIFFPRQHLPADDQKADAIVVLGAAPNSPAIRYRVLRGSDLYGQGKAELVVLSGGRTDPKDESEAQNMARYLSSYSFGVPTILEEHSGNTWENLTNTQKLLPEHASVLLVTDTYHAPRAALIAKSLGYGDVYWSSPDPTYYRPTELVWYYGREFAAIISYLPRVTKVFLGK